MEEYVKVSDLNNIIRKLAKEPAYYHEGEDFYTGICAIEGELMCLSAVKFEEPKVGKWQFNEHDKHGNKKPYCSNCGECHLSSWSDYTRCNYCPTCGAKMVKE